MSEKLTESITFKCSDSEKQKLLLIAGARKLSLSEFIRLLCMKEISEIEELLHSLKEPQALTRDTVENAVEAFELQHPKPLPNISKRTGTKKAQLLRPTELLLPFSN